MSAPLKGFGRRPLAGRSGWARGRRSKASQGGNRGEEGRCLVGRDLWGFEGRGRSAGGACGGRRRQSCRRERRRRGYSVARMGGSGVGAALGEGLPSLRGHRLPAPARGWRRGEAALRGGRRGDGHEVSILIRVGDGDRAGRAPSKVSMMIIRPPQQGHRRAGEGVSVSSSASARALGRGSGAASNWRARSMLRARTAPANRP